MSSLGQGPIRRDGRRCGQQGIALLWTVLFLGTFVLFAGVAIDNMYLILATEQLQVGADAAALAGAAVIDSGFDVAQDAARNIAADNDVLGSPLELAENVTNAEDGDVVVGYFDQEAATFTPTQYLPNAVKIVARRTQDSVGGSIPLLFGSMVGLNTVNVERYAIAVSDAQDRAGILVLDPSGPCALEIGGSGLELVVDEVDPETGTALRAGSVHVNSDHDDAVCHFGLPKLGVAWLNIQGNAAVGGLDAGVDPGFDLDVDLLGHARVHRAPMADPMAWLLEDLPYFNAADDGGAIDIRDGGTVNLGPGYYSGGITLESGTANLAPGLYVLDGAGLEVSGGNLYGEGVMLYVIGGRVNLHTAGDLVLSPPPGGLYAGLTLFQDQGNTQEASIHGTNRLEISGTLYFPGTRLLVSGATESLANQVIARRVRVDGSGKIVIRYDGRNLPDSIADVFLVK